MAGGRQKNFNENEALDAAMHVFWQKGFIGAALSDLTSAMGINKPSLYATFGNKEELFIRATHHYLEHYASPHLKHLSGEGSLEARLKAYLMSVITAQTSSDHPKGCYITNCVAESATSSLPDEAQKLVEEVRDFGEQTFHELLKKEFGKHPKASVKADPAVLARSLTTLLHGTASMARGGKKASELEPVVDTTLKGFQLS